MKLPNIFQPRRPSNASGLTVTAATTTTTNNNSSTHTSRDASPFSFRRESTFLGLNQHDISHDGSNSQVSPQHSVLDETLSRSGTQSSALLLPISSTQDVRNSIKSKRKRKKHKSLLASNESGIEAEKLLREKLGAIENRDFDRPSPRHDGEKTDLSDTAFIDKVKDETHMANNAPEALASKPPIYQNTPARIKTEQKVTSVKA